METKGKMIEAIYKEVADKKLSFGCKIKVPTINNKLDMEIFKTFDMYELGMSKFKDNTDFGNYYCKHGYITVLSTHKSQFMTDASTLGEIENISFISIRMAIREFAEIGKLGYSIIGHPVLIGDVLDWNERKFGGAKFHENKCTFLNEWINKRLPIEEQSEATIKYVYNLIK